MSARVLCHMDASDTIIYVCQKAQTVPGKGKATPVVIPCVRPQSDMMCYMLDRCDLGLGSRQLWYQSLTACRITKPNWSNLSLEMLYLYKGIDCGMECKAIFTPFTSWTSDLSHHLLFYGD